MNVWMKSWSVLCVVVCAGALYGCSDGPNPAPPAATPDVGVDADPEPDPAPDVVEDTAPDAPDPEPEPVPGPAPIFQEDGCVARGQSRAIEWTAPSAAFVGPDARNIQGGWVLRNDRAAFAISPIDDEEAYWYYGGILVDVVALDGCRQAGEERFEELVVLLGSLDIAAPAESTLRGFRGERGEVLSDGSDGGPAVVRVHGVDDRFWLVELELVRQAYESGAPRQLSVPMELEVVVDYILEPGSSVLRTEINVINTLDTPQRVLTGTSLWFGDTTEAFYGASGSLSLAGFGVDAGLPWMVAEGPDNSLAVSLPDAAMAALSVSGVRSMVDATRAVGSRPLSAAGNNGDSRVDTFLVAVGPNGGNSASRHLQPLDGQLPGQSPIMVQVTDVVTGQPIPKASIRIERSGGQDRWNRYDQARTGDDGTADIALVHAPATGDLYRLSIHVPGRPSPDPVSFTLPAPETISFALEPGGTLGWAIKDGEERPMPSQLAVWNEQGQQTNFWTDAAETGSAPLEPGVYTWQAWRGFEYGMVSGEFELMPGGEAQVTAVLPRLVDTTGFLSTDTHLHAGPSPDSDVSVQRRLLTAASAGVEVPVSTDHEIVSDWASQLPQTGLEGWLYPLIGQEVTATIPEHVNMLAVPRDLDHPRGSPVPWYGLDPGQVYTAIRERGAGVVQLNHPKQGCNYMCLLEWEAETASPGLDDPTALGFSPEQSLWSWDFDAVELFNGHTSPFHVENRRDSGLFDDWYNWHLAGHRITGMAVTDSHGESTPGSPRTWFEAPTDVPTEVTDAMFSEAIIGGRTQMSAGAFARVDIGGAGLGQTVRAENGQAILNVRVDAIPEVHVGWVVVFVNCREVASIAATDPEGIVKLDTQVSLIIDEDAAVVVAAFSDQPMPRGWKNYNGTRTPRVTTNPIYVDSDGNDLFDPPGPRACDYSLQAP